MYVYFLRVSHVGEMFMTQ